MKRGFQWLDFLNPYREIFIGNSMANPIFVIGVNRSGTKWLSNLLLNQAGVAGVASDDHHGILETGLLTTLPEVFGPIDNLENRVGMIECFASMDYFRRMGLSKDELYRIQPRHYHDFFGQLMDRMAESKSAPWWLQKFSPVSLPGLIRHFPSARFLLIIRGVVETTQSSLKKSAIPRSKWASLKYLLRYQYGIKQMMAYRNRPGVFVVRYEDLVADTENTMRNICEHVGLEFIPSALLLRYPVNSSFISSAQRDRFLSRSDRLWILVSFQIFRLVPLRLYRMIHWLRRRLKTPRQSFRHAFMEKIREMGIAQPYDN